MGMFGGDLGDWQEWITKKVERLRNEDLSEWCTEPKEADGRFHLSVPGSREAHWLIPVAGILQILSNLKNLNKEHFGSISKD